MVGVPRAVQYGLALILAAVAVFSGWWAYDVFEQLWSYRDSATFVYLALGLPAVAISLACIVGIVCLLRIAPEPSKQKPRGKKPQK